ncbi:hypothetical protein P692DRAFT_20815725 [Suillus brevipes Sb2]|nr:hypothetical protein P692DRAFT_20815725 [Suillus brevipes Sb2]
MPTLTRVFLVFVSLIGSFLAAVKGLPATEWWVYAPKGIQLLQEQLAGYESQCVKLHYEIARLTGERDTIKKSFHDIIQILRLPIDTDPLKFTIGDVIARDSQQSRPTRTSHPKVQFWLRSDYDTWLDSATVSRIKRGTAPYLEEEDGTCITNATLKSIRRRCRAAWAELVVKKLAPPTWARLCASGQTMMRSIMEMEFPVFRLDTDGWKLTLLCTTDYPNWRKRHLDRDGRWKNPDKTAAKHEAMGDDDDDSMHSLADTKPIPSRATVKSNGKKRECTMDDSLDSEPADNLKRQKVSMSSLPQAGHDTTGSPSNGSDVSLFLSTQPSESAGSPTSASNVSLLSSTEHSTPSDTTFANITNSPLPDLPLPPAPHPSPPRHGAYLPAVPFTGNANEENVPVVLKNPLANIFGGPSGIPKLIPTPAIPPSTDSSKGGTVKSGPTTGGVDVKKCSKMRPGSTKNGRNLCALRWIKQTNKNGTTDEFKLYWNTLATAQQDEYQAEAERLDSAGAWKKASDSAVVNGALH